MCLGWVAGGRGIILGHGKLGNALVRGHAKSMFFKNSIDCEDMTVRDVYK